MSEEENKGFKVRDRRIHAEGADEKTTEEPTEETTEETAADEVASEEVAEATAESVDEPADGPADEPSDEPADEMDEGMPINFATFLISLGDSAMIHLGAIPHPATGEPAVDLRTARQTIDIIGILEEKTRGNLDENEQKLMANLLYALRMQFVQADKD